MSDHYSTLEIPRTATLDEIKKAYRRLALKYHPDKNQGDVKAEENFKRVAEAYSVLNDAKKKEDYDRSFNRASSGWNQQFDDFNTFTNSFRNSDFRRTANERARRTQGKTHDGPPDTAYLDINISCEVELKDAVLGKIVELSFARKKIVYTGQVGKLLQYTKEEEIKQVKVNFNLKKTHLKIKKEGENYSAKVRLSKFGHEDVFSRLNIWGEVEQCPLFGDTYLQVNILVPPHVEIEGGSIIQQVEIPLYKAIVPGEKIEIETILDKKYEASIKNPTHLNDLKFVITEGGIVDETGNTGPYIIKFVVIAPKTADLNRSKLDNLRTLLIDL